MEGLIWKNLTKKMQINDLLKYIKKYHTVNLDKDSITNTIKNAIHTLWKKGIIVISKV